MNGTNLFLGWKHPGPIEAACAHPAHNGRLHFWDGNIPAPLKPDFETWANAVAAFLGWKHPGPIEASLRE
ncbi:hypothetical protein SBA3_330015 [Candidatus Sulfopaludibacter sp. SbA3]|nr:hypothetical protein SBA3_330015 [Candidatus Sulfopaludibacter sp. SbA3]